MNKAPKRKRPDGYFINAQPFFGETGPHDIYDGVHGADFMKMYFVFIFPVNTAFSFSEAGKDTETVLDNTFRKVGGFQHVFYVLQLTMNMVVMMVMPIMFMNMVMCMDVYPNSMEAVTFYLLRSHGKMVDRKTFKGLL